MDFGASAADYARHRAGFPPSFFERLRLEGTLLDLGSGTGTVARGFARRGVATISTDLSPVMLAQATDLRSRVAARAEACPFRAGAFRSAVAGQCWHWFDGDAAAREGRRLLSPGGRLAIAHFDYLARAGNVASATERLVLRHNPGWPMAGSDGRYERWRPQLERAGFVEIESFFYDEEVVYTRDGWRGRFRACNGVLALKDAEKIAAFDRDLAALLAADWPAELRVPHRVFVIQGVAPR